jgi:hypothetical protein
MSLKTWLKKQGNNRKKTTVMPCPEQKKSGLQHEEGKKEVPNTNTGPKMPNMKGDIQGDLSFPSEKLSLDKRQTTNPKTKIRGSFREQFTKYGGTTISFLSTDKALSLPLNTVIWQHNKLIHYRIVGFSMTKKEGTSCTDFQIDLEGIIDENQSAIITKNNCYDFNYVEKDGLPVIYRRTTTRAKQDISNGPFFEHHEYAFEMSPYNVFRLGKVPEKKDKIIDIKNISLPHSGTGELLEEIEQIISKYNLHWIDIAGEVVLKVPQYTTVQSTYTRVPRYRVCDINIEKTAAGHVWVTHQLRAIQGNINHLALTKINANNYQVLVDKQEKQVLIARPKSEISITIMSGDNNYVFDLVCLKDTPMTSIKITSGLNALNRTFNSGFSSSYPATSTVEIKPILKSYDKNGALVK